MKFVCRFQAKERFWRHLTTTVHDDLADEEVARIKAKTAKKKFVWIPAPKLVLPNIIHRYANVAFHCLNIYLRSRSAQKHLLSFCLFPRKPLSSRVFECDHCNKSFKYREAFNKHIKFMHPEDGKLLSYKFTCSCCNEQFNHRRTYLSHLKMEHGIKVSRTFPLQFSILR